MDFILADINQLAVLDALSNIFGLAEVKLITAGVPTKDSVHADFSFCANAGLVAPKAISTSIDYKTADGKWAFLIQDSVFAVTAFTVPETITGFIVQDVATHGIYWGGALFDTAVGITAVNQGVSIDMLVAILQLAGQTLPVTFTPDVDA